MIEKSSFQTQRKEHVDGQPQILHCCAWSTQKAFTSVCVIEIIKCFAAEAEERPGKEKNSYLDELEQKRPYP